MFDVFNDLMMIYLLSYRQLYISLMYLDTLYCTLNFECMLILGSR